MTYTALARKWRPRTFADLIGQEAVVTALSNALREQKIAQAYLFSGIRGVGKTSAARLVAKALNCAEAPTPEPCNVCPSCRDVASGASLDVLEIDAATYSRVEQIRELTEGLRYGPTRERWKVVILDEVHRLSRQAFDALLKIVEEPPAFLVFIFATTEIDAVPATILSRCQEFHFRRVPTPVLAGQLRSICEAEAITATDAALRVLARASEGSVRDAVALLDQLATFGDGAITEEAAFALLGGGDLSTLPELLAAIVDGRREVVLEVATRIESEGWDPRAVHHRLMALVRDALHLAAGASCDRLDLPADEAEHLAQIARPVGYESLLRLLHHLLSSEPTIRRSEIPTLALEIAWLRAAELPRLQRLEGLLSDGRPVGQQPRPSSMREAGPASPAAASPSAFTSRSSAPPDQPEDHRERIVRAVADRREGLAARLRVAEGLRIDGSTLVISAAADEAPAFDRPQIREVLDAACREVLGPTGRWRLDLVTLAAPSATTSPTAPRLSSAAPRALAAAPEVQAVLEIFGGSVESVEPLEPASADDEEIP